MARKTIPAIWWLLLAAACGGETELGVGTPTDSAGVLLVPSIPAQASSLRLDERRVVIGEEDAAGHQLYRVGAARLDEDGSILVADGGSREIRRFGPDGGLRGVIGGPGEGPGEFGFLNGFQLMEAGGVAVFDGRLDRITEFGPDATVLVTSRLDPGDVNPDRDGPTFPAVYKGLTRDRRLVGFPPTVIPLEGAEGLRRLSGPLVVFGEERLDTLSTFTQMHAYETQNQGRPFQMVPGLGRLIWDVRDTRLAVSGGANHDIALIDDGVITTRLREDRPREVAPPDSTSPVPIDSLPAYRQLAVDADRRIWAAPGIQPDAAESVWRRFAADGALEAELLGLGPRDRIMDARGDQVLILRFDDLDVETVELWTLTSLEVDGGG